MLTNSDNDIAESLVRRTAIEAGRPASFAGAQQAVQAELKKLKMPVDGALLRDGSGLNRHDRITAGLLTALLAHAADPDRPELRPVLTGLRWPDSAARSRAGTPTPTRSPAVA